jgi:hypothetical protein
MKKKDQTVHSNILKWQIYYNESKDFCLVITSFNVFWWEFVKCKIKKNFYLKQFVASVGTDPWNDQKKFFEMYSFVIKFAG